MRATRRGAPLVAILLVCALYSGGKMYASYGAIAAGEFTDNGHLDLAVVDNIHDTLSILLGDGTGRFKLSDTPIPFSGAQPNTIAVGDFTGDGVEDLAFARGASRHATGV